MKYIFNLLIPILVLLSFSTTGQEVVLSGSVPEYSGEELIFSSYSNYITKEYKVIGRSKVNKDGYFKISFNTDKVLEIHLINGIYDGTLLVEPGRKYDIKLPPPEEKSFKELSNPFFKEIMYYIGYTDTIENDINIKIPSITGNLDNFISKNYTDFIYGTPPRQKIDSFIININKKYPAGINPFQDSFLEYELGYLKYISRYFDHKKMGEEYFYNSPVLYNNGAYMDLFNHVFVDFFRSFPHNAKSESYSSIINYRKGYSSLIKLVEINLETDNRPFTEMLILKGLFDGFYNGDFRATEVIPIMDSIIILSEIPQNKKIAKNIKKSIEHLLPGTNAPIFELYDSDSNMVNLSNFKGKYVYLNFCSYQSKASRRELSLMTALYKKFKRKVEFVTISTDESFVEFIKLFGNNKYQWTYLSFQNQSDILKTYKVKSFPTSFLIDPYGKLILVPALLPSEGFENQFYGVLNRRN